MKNKIFLASVMGAVLSGGLVFVTPVFAQTPTPSTQQNFFQGFVDFFAQKFGLEKTQVESAMTEFKKGHMANKPVRVPLTQEQMEAKVDVHLSALVTKGKITEIQKSAIKTKMAEWHDKYNRETMQSLSHEERVATMEQHHEEVVDWATSQGIDSSYIMGFGFGKGHGMKMRFH